MSMGFIIGIDGSNLRSGGAIAHILRLLEHGDPTVCGISKVFIWGHRSLISQIAVRPWLTGIPIKALDQGLPFQIIWQLSRLPIELKRVKADALFSPGGVVPILCNLPSITISQNLLPFDTNELRRFFWSHSLRWKLSLLRAQQSRSFKNAEGVIFLSKFARDQVLKVVPSIRLNTIIPHGLDKNSFLFPRKARPLTECTFQNPLRILYVSTVFPYKHPWHVAQAACNLRRKHFPIQVDFVGGGLSSSVERLTKTLSRLDPTNSYLCYHGEKSPREVLEYYRSADLFVFASSCETISLTILEAMAAGLPIASSNMGPMPEILGDKAVYFNPEDPDKIEAALRKLIEDHDLRTRLSREGLAAAQSFSWDKTAAKTFSFIAQAINSTFPKH